MVAQSLALGPIRRCDEVGINKAKCGCSVIRILQSKQLICGIAKEHHWGAWHKIWPWTNHLAGQPGTMRWNPEKQRQQGTICVWMHSWCYGWWRITCWHSIRGERSVIVMVGGEASKGRGWSRDGGGPVYKMGEENRASFFMKLQYSSSFCHRYGSNLSLTPPE